MSETVHYTGKVKLVEKLNNETLEEQCERILREHNFTELEKYYDSWEEMFYEELYGKYVIHDEDESIYKIIEKNYEDTEYDIFNAHENKDGTISYEVMYYNGGCSLSEAIVEALDNMESNL